ncbi:F-box only protein 17 like protein [Argiope bruennichi]|uniref:F-box only protein 17 like protein n=1 Tax=Argiope bruennichi TaxID=94029 RepID=A0A8T0G057_ARGBR|nr:F-box only protein 17 like protein [Argiope bruennichi]
MGSKISNLISSEPNAESNTGDSSEFDYTMSFVNFSIPDDLLIDILSYVPAEDLIKNCRLVCKDWKSIVDGHSVWKLKCKREKKCIPSISLRNIPNHYYEKIYIHDPYGKNLIQNPYGEEGLAKWVITRNRGDGFIIENPPAGAEPVPQEVGSQSCFATTYYPCMKHQLIDLLENGISEEILQVETTKIKIGEWFAARFDCASEYHLYVALLNENYHENITSFHDCLVDDFRFKYREEQWVGKEWHSVRSQLGKQRSPDLKPIFTKESATLNLK